MSGPDWPDRPDRPGDANDPRDPRNTESTPPDDGMGWPARDLDEEAPPETGPETTESTQPEAPAVPPIPVSGAIPETGPSEPWDTRRWGERRKATTAEQAVPWLIGLILALAGIVIVLLALIFTDANGGFATEASEAPSTTIVASPSASTSQGSPSVSAGPSATPTATAKPPPVYGLLDMLYLARPNGLGTSELFRDDFATAAAATVVAHPSSDVTHYAVSPDGTASVAIVNRKLLAYSAGKPVRTLASSVDAVTFGADASTVYAVTIARGGTTDIATVNAIGFASGKATQLTSVGYHHPAADQLSTLSTARFIDDGGDYRIYLTSDGNLVFWVSNGGQWRIDPVSGDLIAVARQPVLWSPNGARRITLAVSGLVTTLAVVDQAGATSARVSINGLVSHLRWSPKGDRVVFTLGRSAGNGGVRQNLYRWDLKNGKSPVALTADGASFGADWLGVAQFWQP